MKPFIILAVAVFSAFAISTSQITFDVAAQSGKKPPDSVVLAKEAKLGQVTFNHLDHITKSRTIDGAHQIACIECHHTAQPAAEAAKHPPLKTVWPADRNTTLTGELLEKDANALGAVCTDCHARVDTKPKLLPEIPQIKFEGGTQMIALTNQQAFHRACGGCHDQIVSTRKDVNPPTSKKCTACHKKTAA